MEDWSRGELQNVDCWESSRTSPVESKNSCWKQKLMLNMRILASLLLSGFGRLRKWSLPDLPNVAPDWVASVPLEPWHFVLMEPVGGLGHRIWRC
jgi:hypothetical protein